MPNDLRGRVQFTKIVQTLLLHFDCPGLNRSVLVEIVLIYANKIAEVSHSGSLVLTANSFLIEFN